MERTSIFTRKRALTIVFFISMALFLLILGRWLLACRDEQTSLMTAEGRKKFLMELGWEADFSQEHCQPIRLPDEMDPVLEEYNRLQLEQGYDLRHYLGKDCLQYTYRLTNYEGSTENVYLCLYVHGRRVIAGDIHTNALNGFMHGIRRLPAK